MITKPLNPTGRIPLLAAALAAAGLTGCMASQQNTQIHALTPEEQAAAKNVEDYIKRGNAAMDPTESDQERDDTARRIAAIDAAEKPVTVAPTTQPVAADAASAMTSLSVPAPAASSRPKAIATEPTVDQALAVLRRQAAAHPALTTTLAIALLDGAQGRAPNPRAIARLSPPDQKILTDILAALEGMTPVSASDTLADRASQLVDAALKWQTDADLTLPRAALASRVDSFGVYTPVDAKFPQGTAAAVILYCEVAHFTSHRIEDGRYETNLSQQDTLLTTDGLLLWRPTAEDITDRSLNQRHDFYLVKKITLPDTLPVGKYTLRLSVTDRTTNKLATTNLPIEITAN